MQPPDRRRVSPEPLAWLVALLPLAAANLAYLASASAELVPWCLPYVEGCTSVSRAARHGLATSLFKGLMFPFAGLLAVYWHLMARWLSGFAPQRRRLPATLRMLGILAALFCALYTTYLGAEGETYQWLRRYGINLYFSCTILGQFLLTHALYADARLPPALRRGLLGLCAGMLALGLASIPLQYLVAGRDAAINVLEWDISLLMLAHFALAGRAWGLSGFRLAARPPIA